MDIDEQDYEYEYDYAEGIERYNQLLNTGEMKFKIYKIYFTDGTSEIIDYDDKTSMR